MTRRGPANRGLRTAGRGLRNAEREARKGTPRAGGFVV